MSGAQKFLIRISNDQVCLIRGHKLFEQTSGCDDASVRDRWITLELYYSVEKVFVLIVRYDSETTNPEETEVSSAHAEKLGSWREVAHYLDTYDFMRHVRLDDYCGGHISHMQGVGFQEAQIRLHFRRTALDFLAECLQLKSEWYAKWQIELW